MEYEINDNGEIVEINVKGRLDTATAPILEEALKEKLNEMTGRLVFNIPELTYVSSAGLRTFLALSKLTADRGGVSLRNVSDDIMEIFEMTGFDAILNFEE